jgi:pimeloyl-ACP methyl ester carboxylesterase
MQPLSEFRNPTRWYSKLIAALVAIIFFVLMAGGIIAGYVVYNIVTVNAVANDEAVNLASFPGHPEDVSFQVGGAERDGWFFPGLKLAPTIVLCPGYHASRGELLPLATALQDHEYNVFLFDFDVHGSSAGRSTLGFEEVQELQAAVATISQRNDVDRSRFGLWGTNMGGYAAVGVAESDPRVHALVIESVYDRPQDMVQLLVARDGLDRLPLLGRFTEQAFIWLNYANRDTRPLSSRLSRLAGTAKIFVEANDAHGLVESTHRLFVLSPEPKQEVLLSQGNYAGMLDDEKRSYENRVVTFFLSTLPPEPR